MEKIKFCKSQILGILKEQEQGFKAQIAFENTWYVM